VRLSDKSVKIVLFITAFSTITILFLITLFIFKEGLPFIIKQGLFNFLLGKNWYPSENVFQILPFLLGSIWVTFFAILFGVPLALGCSIYLAEYVSPRLRGIMKPAIELLAAIPSVVYGFIGVVILAPFIRAHFGGPGFSVLAASIILAIMILPTVIGITIDSLLTVPKEYKEGSYALGATKWQTISRVMLPAARTGILAAVILGMGRAIGETMVVLMIAGNSIQIPGSILEPVRTLTSNIALEMGYAEGIHREALFATGVILFVLIMVLNIIAIKISSLKK
jgi:phosphate ABC transporter permease protein PstC